MKKIIVILSMLLAMHSTKCDKLSKEAQIPMAARVMAEVGPYVATALALWQESVGGRPLSDEEQSFLWYCKAAGAAKATLDGWRFCEIVADRMPDIDGGL